MIHPIFCHSGSLALASPSKLNCLNPFLSCTFKPQITRDHEVPDPAAHILVLLKKAVCVKEEVSCCVNARVCVSRTAQNIQCYKSVLVTFNNKMKNHHFSVINKQCLLFVNINKHNVWKYIEIKVSVNRWSLFD